VTEKIKVKSGSEGLALLRQSASADFFNLKKSVKKVGEDFNTSALKRSLRYKLYFALLVISIM
jgi:hypothetical protein